MSRVKEIMIEIINKQPDDSSFEEIFQVLIKENEKFNKDENPLLELIGGAEHGSLAQDIDKELYGE